jgi:hypothetical protein
MKYRNQGNIKHESGGMKREREETGSEENRHKELGDKKQGDRKQTDRK